jgi:hypothetical protein
MSRLALISFIIGLLFLSGCGSDGETTELGASSEAVETDSDADAESNGGEGDAVEIPSDFAIPTVEGAVLVIDSLPGIPDGAYLQLLYPGDRYDELVEFYDSWVSEQPAEWSPTPADTSDGVIWFSFALEGEPGYGQSVTIAGPSDSDGRAAVALVAESDNS